MAVTLNLKLSNAEVTEKSPISVFFKHFQQNQEGKFVPTLYRNAEKRAKEQFLNDLSKTKELILSITATTDATKNEWFNLCNQASIKFNTKNKTALTNEVDSLIKQTMSAINKDENIDLYERISVVLIIKDENHTQNKPQKQTQAVAEDELPF